MNKNCSICNKSKPLEEFYKQEKQRKNGATYIYYHPECKSCTSKRSMKWHKKNPEKAKMFYKKRDDKPEYKKKAYLRGKKRRENGDYKKWQRNNKDKLYIYRLKRMHKTHDITNEEWTSCKEYFNHSCAYCGLSENEHRELHDQDLHKEHVDHDGSNDLSNCVPSCKSCNSKKHTSTLDEWYLESNEFCGVFSKEKLNKIYKWLNNDYLKYLSNETQLDN